MKNITRWSPSTMASILDLIIDFKKVTKVNENISFLYIVYHVMLFISTLLTPGTIFMLIVGAITTAVYKAIYLLLLSEMK
jgi:chitin synthase